jgi:membrane protein implicated in regulation of membrane protease activity
MTTPGSEPGGSVWPILALLVAFVLCCAGPAVVALLAAAGLGSVLARSGPYLAFGAAAAVLAVVVVLWRRRCACWVSGPPLAPGNDRSRRGLMARRRAGVAQESRRA